MVAGRGTNLFQHRPERGVFLLVDCYSQEVRLAHPVRQHQSCRHSRQRFPQGQPSRRILCECRQRRNAAGRELRSARTTALFSGGYRPCRNANA